jgi:hypothetical protein
VVEVAAEKNSTLVLPFPVELLRFFDRAAQGSAAPGGPEAGGKPAAEPEVAAADEPAEVEQAGRGELPGTASPLQIPDPRTSEE